MAKPVFVDTWGWVELGHRRALRHDDVRRFYHGLVRQRVPIITTDYVLDETMTLLFRREVFPEAVQFMAAILSAADQAAIRILITAVKGSRAPLALLPALVLQDAQGHFTEATQALNEGRAWIGSPS